MSREEMDALSDHQWVGTRIAALILGLHQKTVVLMYRDGVLPGCQPRGRHACIRFRVGDLRSFGRGGAR